MARHVPTIPTFPMNAVCFPFARAVARIFIERGHRAPGFHLGAARYRQIGARPRIRFFIGPRLRFLVGQPTRARRFDRSAADHRRQIAFLPTALHRARDALLPVSGRTQRLFARSPESVLLLDSRPQVGRIRTARRLHRHRRGQSRPGRGHRQADVVGPPQPHGSCASASLGAAVARMGAPQRHSFRSSPIIWACGPTICGARRPSTKEPFSTPRSWHIFSDALWAFGAGDADRLPSEGTLEALAFWLSHAVARNAVQGFLQAGAQQIRARRDHQGRRALAARARRPRCFVFPGAEFSRAPRQRVAPGQSQVGRQRGGVGVSRQSDDQRFGAHQPGKSRKSRFRPKMVRRYPAGF